MTPDEPAERTAPPRCRLSRSGHAVVAVFRPAGRGIVVATIEPGDDALGTVRHHPWGGKFRPDVEVTPHRREQLGAAIVTSLAGVVAQRHGTGQRHDWTGARHDLSQASDLASYLVGSPDQARLYLAFQFQVARDLIRDHWPAVERVAAALLDRTTLTGDDVRSVVLDSRR